MANRRNNVISNLVREESVSESEKSSRISRAGSTEDRFVV
jgi:hypothetical protein